MRLRWPSSGDRRVSPLLMLTLISWPQLGCWFLLRRGYPNTVRASGFGFAGVNMVLSVIVHLAR